MDFVSNCYYSQPRRVRARRREIIQSVSSGNRVFGGNTPRVAECANEVRARSGAHPYDSQFPVGTVNRNNLSTSSLVFMTLTQSGTGGRFSVPLFLYNLDGFWYFSSDDYGTGNRPLSPP